MGEKATQRNPNADQPQLLTVITWQALPNTLLRHEGSFTLVMERQLMPEVLVYERATPSFAPTLANRGHQTVYRANSNNHWPGGGRSHWYTERTSAKWGFCATAVPLAEARSEFLGTPG